MNVPLTAYIELEDGKYSVRTKEWADGTRHKTESGVLIEDAGILRAVCNTFEEAETVAYRLRTHGLS